MEALFGALSLHFALVCHFLGAFPRCFQVAQLDLRGRMSSTQLGQARLYLAQTDSRATLIGLRIVETVARCLDFCQRCMAAGFSGLQVGFELAHLA